MTMTKTELIEKIAKELGCTKKLAADFLNLFIKLITGSVAHGHAVRLQGFGTFDVSHRAARTGVNPQNPSQKIKIPAMKVPKFKPGSDLKKAVR